MRLGIQESYWWKCLWKEPEKAQKAFTPQFRSDNLQRREEGKWMG